MSKVINGYIKAENGRLINDAGEILLKGWGIGNWLLCEGYMWQYDGSARLDRPRHIEAVIRELVGEEEAEHFWKAFRTNYFTRTDLARIKAQGYNSIRLPLNWRLFMVDEPQEVRFLEAGFEILERVVSWCEEEDLYIWIDMHGAPGGQTGANIDDCVDEMPRLFMDEDKFEKGLILWEEISRRYKDRAAVAGYDLLNEPIRPANGPAVPSCEYLVPELIRFYKEAIARIRGLGDRHCIALEGHHWATDTTVFNQQYDDNWVLHFHRYWDNPEEEIFEKFLRLREKYRVPLWLGETGENSLEWFAAISAICEREHISYHFWPYKKMGETASAEVRRPKNWAAFIDYAKQGLAPSLAESKAILAEFLENMKLENCLLHDEVDAAILRNQPYKIKATNFIAESSLIKARPKNTNIFGYKTDFGIELAYHHEPHDESWMNYDIVLSEGESLHYPWPNFAFEKLLVRVSAVFSPGQLKVGDKIVSFEKDGLLEVLAASNSGGTLELSCQTGKLQIEALCFI